MTTYIIRRLLYSILVLIVASIIIFFFVSAVGDPLAQVRAIPKVSQQTIHSIVRRNHLDQPLIVQYWYWVKTAALHRFGHTLLAGEPIWPDLRLAIANTLQLVAIAEIVSVIAAILVGVYSAVKQYSLFDYAATAFSFIGFSTPVFWLALILQVIFTDIYLDAHLRIFYTSGFNSAGVHGFIPVLADRLQHLALPVFTLAFVSVAQYSRYLRASMLEVINSDYVRTARAKGVADRRVVMTHALRNALIPFTTVVAVDFGQYFGGVIVTESVFSLPGMGLYFLRALGASDLYPIMAWLMVTAVMVILFNLIADILYGVLDPRIRYD